MIFKRRTWTCCLALQFLAVEARVADAIPRTEESEVVTMMSNKHELLAPGELLGTTDFVSGSVQHQECQCQECQWPYGRLAIERLYPYARDIQVSDDPNEFSFYFRIGYAAPGYAGPGDYYEDYKDEQEAVVYEGRRFAEDLGYEPEDLGYSP